MQRRNLGDTRGYLSHAFSGCYLLEGSFETRSCAFPRAQDIESDRDSLTQPRHMERVKSAGKLLKNTFRGIGAKMMARYRERNGRTRALNFPFVEIIQPRCALFASTSTKLRANEQLSSVCEVYDQISIGFIITPRVFVHLWKI